MIVNSKARGTRPITLEVLVQEQNLKLREGERKQHEFISGSGGEL